jgi:hypothetical protein
LDDNTPNASSYALTSHNSNPYIQQFPADKEEAETRTLPVIAPTSDIDGVNEEILLDWSTETDVLVNDKYYVDVTTPTGPLPKVFCAEDTSYIFSVRQGSGAYKFTVTLKAIDGREQVGDEVTVIYP